MPELPEVEALARFLTARTADRVITGIEIGQINALRTVIPQPEDLVGAQIVGVHREGKWLVLSTIDGSGDSIHLVWHLARAGWVRWSPVLPATSIRPGRSPIALRVRLENGAGFDLTEAGTRKRVAVHIVTDPQQVPLIGSLGVDPLSPAFTFDRFSQLLSVRNQQIKGLLRDQSQIAGIGNAYSDEILFAAHTSPFALTGGMSPQTAERIYTATVEVLNHAVETASGLPASELKDSKRQTLRIHGRNGQPCAGWDGTPCEDTVHEVSFADTAFQYCPTCQTGGKPLADRRMSRLLK